MRRPLLPVAPRRKIFTTAPPIIVARHPAEQYAPMMTLWECAIRKQAVVKLEVGERHRHQHLMPPMTKVPMKPMDHWSGVCDALSFGAEPSVIVCVPIRQTSAQRVEISGEVASLNGSLWATPPIYQSGHRTHEVFSKHRYLTRPTINHQVFLLLPSSTECLVELHEALVFVAAILSQGEFGIKQ